jgi:hypothetical protein
MTEGCSARHNHSPQLPPLPLAAVHLRHAAHLAITTEQSPAITQPTADAWARRRASSSALATLAPNVHSPTALPVGSAPISLKEEDHSMGAGRGQHSKIPPVPAGRKAICWPIPIPCVHGATPCDGSQASQPTPHPAAVTLRKLPRSCPPDRGGQCRAPCVYLCRVPTCFQSTDQLLGPRTRH